MRAVRSAVVVAAAGLLAACVGDPVREMTAHELGPEQPGVRPGPLHRPGQPCLVCHPPGGGGKMPFSMAGTVYQTDQVKAPLPDVLVRLSDAQGRKYSTGTNCAGNFFVRPADFDPDYPVWVTLEFGGVEWPMKTAIFREGSCAACHGDPAGLDSVGYVYFAPVPVDFPPSGCP